MTIKNPGDWFTEEIADKEHVIRATFLHWMAAHGAMCLALRHPQMTGASRELIVDMINGIELLFKIKGMPQDELKQMHLIESDARGVERTAGVPDARDEAQVKR